MSTSKIRVLYVDDEADVREVFASVFADEFDVRLAESGEAALSLMEGEELDVLVSDMRMDGMRGS
ncbi:MAG TPA: response regulator, partial [Polyangiaceae bacterium]